MRKKKKIKINQLCVIPGTATAAVTAGPKRKWNWIALGLGLKRRVMERVAYINTPSVVYELRTKEDSTAAPCKR